MGWLSVRDGLWQEYEKCFCLLGNGGERERVCKEGIDSSNHLKGTQARKRQG